MEIIFVINQMGGIGCGGADRVVGILANELVKDRKVSILSLTDNNMIDRQLANNVDVVFLPKISSKSKKTYNLLRIIYSIQLIRKNMKKKPNAIYISFVNWASICTLIARGIMPIKVIVSERTDPRKEPSNAIARQIRDFLYSKADKIVFQTTDAMSYFSKNTQKQGCIIANPIKANLPVCNYSNRVNHIIAVGRLEKQKNYPLLFSAFAMFLEKHNEFVLHIYGQGNQELALKDQISQLGIESHVVFEGFHSNVCDLISNGTMYVISSDFEGMSNSMLEALAMGLPVIATDCPVHAARDLIQSYDNGIVVPVGDAVKLCEAMCYVVENPKEAEKMGNNAMKIRETQSVPNITQQWIEVLEAVENE